MKKYQAIYSMLFFLLLQSAYGNWQYRRTISITPADTILTDYQLLITLTPGNFDYTHSVGDSGQDLRFSTDGTGNSSPDIHYWIEEWNENDTSKVWIKVPSVSSVDTTVVFMYHGNSTATSVSNGDSTFIFFDDFEDGIIDSPWVEVEYIGSITENNGYLETSECGQYGGQYCVDGYAYVYLDLLQAVPGFELTEPFRIRVVTWNFEDSYHQGGEVANTALWNQVPNHNWPIDAVFFRHADPSNQVGHYQGYNGGTFLGNYALMEDRWFIEEFRFDGSQMELWFDGISKDTISNWGPVEAYIALGNTRDSQENIDNNKWDNLAIAKYTALEPSVAVSTTEETGSWSLVTVDTSLVAYYPFNGNANDESGNGNDGTVNGATLTTDRFGNDSNAYSFDGVDDYIISLSSTLFDFDNADFTILVWINSSWTGSSDNEKRIVNYGGSVWNDYGITYLDDGKVSAWLADTPYYVTSTTHLGDSQWHHIVFIRDNTNDSLKIYTDTNKEHAIAGGSGNLPHLQSDRRLTIGRKQRTSGQSNSYFNGAIDDIRIYNRALTLSEIQYFYHEGGWQQVNIALSVPEVSASVNDTVLVPLNVQFSDTAAYSSAEITIGGYQNGLDFIEVVTDSSLTGSAGWTYAVNETDSLLITWSAGAQNITGSGVFCWLKFVVNGNNCSFVTINIESAVFNTGTDPVDITNGGVNIEPIPNYGDVDSNGLIQAYDASLILKHLVGLDALECQGLANAEVSTNDTLTALDAALILQYGVGLIDTLPYGAPLYASGDVNLSNGIISAGQPVDVEIYLNNGDNILSFEGLASYNPDHLTYDSVTWSELLNGFSIEANPQLGTLQFAGAGSIPDGQEGVFATLHFTVNSNFSESETVIRLERLRWNEEPVMEAVAASTLVLGVVDNHAKLPERFNLHQNYPNPFNPTTTMRFDLPENSHTRIVVYDIMGREVLELVNGEFKAGYHSVAWNGKNAAGKDVPTGIYFARLITNEYPRTIKLVLMK